MSEMFTQKVRPTFWVPVFHGMMNSMNPDQEVDVSMIEDNLRLTLDERLISHQNALDLVWALQEAGKQLNEKSEPTS